jgi:hypothetical protein
MKKKTLHNSGVRLLTSEAIYVLIDHAPEPGFFDAPRLSFACRTVVELVGRQDPLTNGQE